jgi:hypothetical protein
MRGSSTVSILTSRLPCQANAFMFVLWVAG